MNETPNESGATDAESEGSSPWAAMAVLVVVLITLCSAIYFVEIRKEELKAANAVSEANAPQAGAVLPVSVRPEKD